jgi:hypothetical protein
LLPRKVLPSIEMGCLSAVARGGVRDRIEDRRDRREDVRDRREDRRDRREDRRDRRH